jgi:hypothetical protein
MHTRQDRVPHHDSGSRITHYPADLLLLICFEAVNGTLSAGWFIDVERAHVYSFYCIFKKGSARCAQGMFPSVMVSPAVDPHHSVNGFNFSLDPVHARLSPGQIYPVMLHFPVQCRPVNPKLCSRLDLIARMIHKRSTDSSLLQISQALPF